MPKVSVVMAAYNESESDIRKAIDSILNQSFKDFEFIIVLDNSQNESLRNVLLDYEKRDKRIKVAINEQNIGLASSLNRGIKLASSNLICRMDADDISCLNRLELQVKRFEDNSDLDVLSSSIVKIDEYDNEISKCIYRLDQNKINKILLRADIIVHPSVMFKKDKIEALGCYRNFPTAQDFDLWLRCVTANYKIEVMEDILLHYRVRSNSITSTKALLQWLTHEYIIKLYKQREKNGIDDYSEFNYKRFLDNKNFNDKQKNKFNVGLMNIGELKKNINNKRYLSAVINFNKLLFSHKEMPKYLFYIYKLSKFQQKK